MICNVIGSGSSGNAVILDKHILVDCGVPFKRLQAFAKDLRLVLLTHKHGNYFHEGPYVASWRLAPHSGLRCVTGWCLWRSA